MKISKFKNVHVRKCKDRATRRNLKIQKLENSIVERCSNPTKSFYASQVLYIKMRHSLDITLLERYIYNIWGRFWSFLQHGTNMSRIIIRRVSCCPTLLYWARKYRYLTNTPHRGCTLFATIRYKIFIAFQRGLQRTKSLL